MTKMVIPPAPPLPKSEWARIVDSQKVMQRDEKNMVVGNLWYYWATCLNLRNGIQTEAGERRVRRWLAHFPAQELFTAMDIAAAEYVKFDAEQNPTQESAKIAFEKIPKICRYRRDDPDMAQIFYIHGILRNRIQYFNARKALLLLQGARQSGVTLVELKAIATAVKNWKEFSEKMRDVVPRNDTPEAI